MSVITKAPPSAPLALEAGTPALFMKRDEEKVPCVLTLSGSSGLELTPFNVVATGTVKPASAGTVILTLYGMAKDSAGEDAADPSAWLPLASSIAEPIGGAGDPEQTMWMIKGEELMVYTESGKLQGTFKSNVADNPSTAINLAEHPEDIEAGKDPLYIFAVGASFTPEVTEEASGRQAKEDTPPACELTLELFQMTD